MSRGKGSIVVKALAAVAVFAANGFSQNTARIPVVVNANASVSIIPPAGVAGAVGVTNRAMSAGVQEVLEITLEGGSSVLYRSQRLPNAPASVRYGKGRILLELHPQTFGNAQVSLFSASGRRVLRGDVSAAKSGAADISRSNVAKGVYLLSVKGSGGSSFSSKVAHGGGRLDIGVSYSNVAGFPLMKRADAGDGASEWTIKITPVDQESYADTSYAFIPVEGPNPAHNITLRKLDGEGGTIDYGSFTDDRDGKTYKTVVIGEQTWMAENLNYETAEGSWCYGEDGDVWNSNGDDYKTLSDEEIQSNCNTYGRLYTWAAAMGLADSYNSSSASSQIETPHQGACPVGWHVPTRDEWNTLVNYVGSSTAGTQLKAESPDWNGTDDHGFSALPGGARGYIGMFSGLGAGGWWWTATADGRASFAWYRYMMGPVPGSGGVFADSDIKRYGFSVRCVQD